jgi:hypothetical protein
MDARIQKLVAAFPAQFAAQVSAATIEISDFEYREIWQRVHGISRPSPASPPQASP